MKTHIKDLLQVTVAILLTGSMAHAMAPPKVTHNVQPPTKKVAVVRPKTSPPKPIKPKVVPKAVSKPKPVVAAPVKPQPAAVPVATGSHEDWMAAAGIAKSDWPAVDYIISHESSWDVNATEPNTGAHGLPQALPYSKTGCGWSDPICQLKWADGYAKDRYGSWWAAYSFWVANRLW